MKRRVTLRRQVPDDLRSIVEYHLILYREIPGAIDVLAVTHGSRRIRSLLLGRI